MASNHGVVYLGPGKVEVQSIDYPVLKTPQGKKIDHGVIIKPITTNICGSDQHMVRGRTTAPPGLVLGHEITGEVIEAGRHPRPVHDRRSGSEGCRSPNGESEPALRPRVGEVPCLLHRPDTRPEI